MALIPAGALGGLAVTRALDGLATALGVWRAVAHAAIYLEPSAKDGDGKVVPLNFVLGQ